MEEILLDLVPIGSLIIFAAVGVVAYSISITMDHPMDPIQLKFVNVRRYFLSNGFLIFAIINFVGILFTFTSISLACFQFESISFVIPFFVLSIGVWWITCLSVIDLLWRISK